MKRISVENIINFNEVYIIRNNNSKSKNSNKSKKLSVNSYISDDLDKD